MKYTRIQFYKDRQPVDNEGNKNEAEPIVAPSIPMEDLAKVKYSTGITINLENFNSARVDVGIELPTHLSELDGAYEYASEYCSDKLAEEIGHLQALRKVMK